MQDDGEDKHDEAIGPLALARCKGEAAPTKASLQNLAYDPSPFVVDESSLKQRREGEATNPVWGCGCQWHNVCKAEVA